MLVHVIEIPVSSYKYRRVARSVLEVLEEAGWEILSAEETRARSKGVPVEVVLTSGDPANKILSVTKSKSCDCIVMGKRGRGRIQRLLLGSVSDQVARLSEVPVVIVK